MRGADSIHGPDGLFLAKHQENSNYLVCRPILVCFVQSCARVTVGTANAPPTAGLQSRNYAVEAQRNAAEA